MNLQKPINLITLCIQISLLASCATVTTSTEDKLNIVGDWRELETEEKVSIRIINDKIVIVDFLHSGENCDLILEDIDDEWCLFFANTSFDTHLSPSGRGVFLMYRFVPKDDYFVIYEYLDSYLGQEHLKRILTGKATLDFSRFSYEDPQIFVRMRSGRKKNNSR